MNISQAVQSSLSAVDLQFLTDEEVRKTSVKRLTSPITFDTLLHPVPGGMYDTAMGAFLDNACSTCNMDIHSCPGHCGHIELPLAVYHCTFIDHIYRLLKAQCLQCWRLKIPRVAAHLYTSKLRLIRLGLLREAEELEDITWTGEKGTDVAGAGDVSDSDNNSDDEKNMEQKRLIEKRTAFTDRTISRFMRQGRHGVSAEQTEAVATARKQVLREFYSEIAFGKKCPNCGYHNPSYRKNGATSIFRKPLSIKLKARNQSAGFNRVESPIVAIRRRNELEAKLKRKAERKANAELDEGVADMDSSTSDENEIRVYEEAAPAISEDGEPSEESEDERTTGGLTEGTSSLVANEAIKSRKRKRKSSEEEEEKQQYINPQEVRAYLTQLFDLEQEVLQQVFWSQDAGKQKRITQDMFFRTALLVPPNRFRRENKTGPDEIAEAPENSLYNKILASCDELYEIRREISGQVAENRQNARTYNDLQTAMIRLQDNCNAVIDKDKNPVRGLAAIKNPEGIKQKFEKKEGMFRMNVMGKRVNFAARSVISPDPNIETDEIGVPPVFAMTLTYPEPVTDTNYEELKQAIINGPTVWPGAVSIEQENGQVILLKNKSIVDRQGLANTLLAPSESHSHFAKPKKVHRHLINGDIVIMNRQPTLHKPSMMAHKAKVLPGEKTIRLHYANCKTYNADFDGDEMNMHFPQNELARAEAMLIANTDNQYLSATAGEPLRGLVQDHISMGVWLTSKGMLFNREEYHEMLYSCLRPEHRHTASDRINTVPPAILKPASRWTGKQIIDTILENIRPDSHDVLTFESKSKTDKKLWGTSEEDLGRVLMTRGELLLGTLDKNQIGNNTGGLVHCVYEAYGRNAAGKLISILGRLLTRMLNVRGFSCGVDDLVMTVEGEAARRQALDATKDAGLEVAAKYVTLEGRVRSSEDPELLSRLADVTRDDEKLGGLDGFMNSKTNQITTAVQKACLPSGLQKPFPFNQMQTMTASGAKGSMVNASQISTNLGQQVLEGRRVPVMVSGRTLPSFKPYESNVRAGGYIVDRFITGVRPQEYYFHTMSGREGLIDTAVKTSRSGYLQRCLVKGMEGMKVGYDTTVRDSDGTMIQTLYGEDGIDMTKATGLENFKFIGNNFMSIFASLNARDELLYTRNEDARKYNRKAEKEYRKTGDENCMDPAMFVYPPARNAGSTSEVFMRRAKEYADKNPDGVIAVKSSKESSGGPRKKQFEELVDLNYLKALAEPGEAVGVVAAQSLGEPSTQMTLNTFHLAGVATKNVTLGTPRLREILMTATANIKTPTMFVYFNEGLPKEHQEDFAKGLTKRNLSEITDSCSVDESLGDKNYAGKRIYKIKLKFYPTEEYTAEYSVQTSDVDTAIVTRYLPLLKKNLKKEMKKREVEKSDAAVSEALPDIGKSAGREQAPQTDEAAEKAADREGGDSDDEEKGDDDATDAKRRANQDEGLAYEEDDEDVEIIQDGEREASPDRDEDDEEDAAEKTSNEKQSNGDAASDSSSDDSDSDSSANASARLRKSSLLDAAAKKFSELQDLDISHKRASCTITIAYDSGIAKVLVLPLVTAALHQTVIHAIPDITSALVQKPANEDKTVKSGNPKDNLSSCFVQGENLMAMRDHVNVINPNSLYSNSVHAMLHVYGVEAARNTLIRELQEVFGAHSIDVGVRHLMLVADYMTRDGGYRAFSRGGMVNSTDVFKKASFETSSNFLRDAVLEGEGVWGRESMGAPSAAITLGKLAGVGTGICDVLVDVSERGKKSKAEMLSEEQAMERTKKLSELVRAGRVEIKRAQKGRAEIVERRLRELKKEGRKVGRVDEEMVDD